jgi:Na+/H+-dicarboxylate symporter
MIDTLVGMFPKNIFASLSEGNMLQIMVFAIIFGIAIVIMGGKESDRIRELVHYFTSVMIEMIKIIMKFAPIGVFCLLVKAIATQGYSTIIGLALYIITILIGLALQFVLVYAPILIFTVKMNPFTFIKSIGEVAAVAFATSSSKATLPISMEVTEKKFGVTRNMVRFLIPLGASINMNGAAIMQGVGIIFISQIYNVDLSFPMLCTIIFTAIFTSAGAAGVPSGATIMLTSILLMAGIPAEGIALIMGVDRIVDMCRTVVNISGDIVCAVAVASSEGAITKTYEESKQLAV